MKRMFLIALCSTVLFVSNASALISIDYNYAIAADGTLTTPYSAIVDTFDDPVRPGWTYTGNGIIRNGPVSGVAGVPYAVGIMTQEDQTNYYAVPETSAGGPFSVTVDFGGGEYNYLGLFWGSIDTYNQIEFLNNGLVVTNGTWGGNDLPAPSSASGDQSAINANLYVNFYDVPDFDAVRFTSFSGYGGVSPYAFEFDNLAVIPIPAPGALLLGLLGTGIAGLKLRKYA